MDGGDRGVTDVDMMLSVAAAAACTIRSHFSPATAHCLPNLRPSLSVLAAVVTHPKRDLMTIGHYQPTDFLIIVTAIYT